GAWSGPNRAGLLRNLARIDPSYGTGAGPQRARLPPRLRLGAGGGQRHRGRERLGIDLEMDDGGLARLLRRRQRRPELRGLLHRGAVAAEGAGIGGEIRILKPGPYTAAWVMAVLVVADGGDDSVGHERHNGKQGE